MNFMLPSNCGCPGPGHGIKGCAEVPGRFAEVMIAVVPVSARMIPMAIRNAFDSTTVNRAPLTAALAEAAVTDIAEADLVDVDVIAAKTVSAPRKWERLTPLRASCFVRAVLAR